MKRSRHVAGVARVIVAVLAMAVVAGPLAVAPSPAAADPWPSVAFPDRGKHSYCFFRDHMPNQAVRDRMRWSMNNLQDQTQVDVVRHSSCRLHTDVRWMQRPIGDPGDGFLGRTRCMRIRDNGLCDRFQIRVYWGEIRRHAGHPRYEARHTACHELGHSVGLSHYRNEPPDVTPLRHSCMRTGVWDSGAYIYKSYGHHHINHVNAWF